MCKDLAKHHDVLLVAPAAPADKEALAGEDPSAMSSVFAREVLQALGRPSRGRDTVHVAQQGLFHAPNHPCGVIDFMDTGSARSVRSHLDKADPAFILLLGREVQKRIDEQSLAGPGRTVMSLGFPIGNNDKENRQILEARPDLLDALRRAL